MAGGMQYAEDDPRHHPAKMKALLAEVAQHARDEAVKNQRCSSASSVRNHCRSVGRTRGRYDHYGKRSEPAWRGTQGARTQGRQE
jgi:hypothetical protein